MAKVERRLAILFLCFNTSCHPMDNVSDSILGNTKIKDLVMCLTISNLQGLFVPKAGLEPARL